ncbi:MAG: glycosyltransferase family 39 protein [Elainellaceae cyanobacterium]
MRSSLTLLVIATVGLGIFFRAAHLDRKVYWHDEVFTSLRAVGYIGDEVGSQLFNGEVWETRDLMVYQTLSPERDWGDTWRSLKTHPEHPPLYYLLTRLWITWFGSSVAAVRSLSVLFGLLSLPAMYWLTRELFDPFLTPRVAIALFAVSPFHVLYAQEARQYSLWTLTTLLTCAALLRALRRQTPGSWLIYSATLVLNFYTSLFSVLTVIVHGLYGLVRARERIRSQLLPMIGAIALAGIGFLPWLAVLIGNWDEFQRKTNWTSAQADRAFLAKLWGLHFSSSLVDWGLDISHPYTYIVPPLVLILLGYALYRLYQHRAGTAVQTWLFVSLLIGVPVVAFILPDLLLGGQRSAQTRYFVLAQIGVQLAIAGMIAYHLSQSSGRSRQFGRGLLGVLLVLGIVSCTLSAQASTWWNKGVSYLNGAMATVLNSSEAPLVIGVAGDNSLGNIISLARASEGNLRFQLLPTDEAPDLVPFEGEQFLFYPSDRLLQALQAQESIMVQPLGLPLDGRLLPEGHALSKLMFTASE